MIESSVITICESFDESAAILADFLKKHQAVFIRCEPEIIDFRSEYTGTVTLLGKDSDGVQFVLPKNNFRTFVGMLTWSLFGGDKVLFTWDIKRLFSYFYHRLGRKQIINVLARIVDIKYGESFLGIDGKCPQTFEEAQQRAKVIVRDDKCWNVHHRLHIPLSTRVIPKIETAGLRDFEDRMIRHTFYDIEGQVHGRLRCSQVFDNGVLAHNLKKEDRLRFRPNQDHVFAVFDYKSMEVHVLHWLSQDERLGKIISSGRDIYSTIYSLLYERKCSADGRQFIKDAFLPIVYGMQVDSISARLKVSKDEAETLLNKINKFFGTAMGWVQSQQDKLKLTSVVTDYFGRPRSYVEKHWAVRNAVVQGPAAVVCLEKLIALYDRLFSYCEIVASIHDAYVLDVPKRDLYDVVFYAIETLQGPSVMAPGISLKVDVNVGTDLENLTPFNV